MIATYHAFLTWRVFYKAGVDSGIHVGKQDFISGWFYTSIDIQIAKKALVFVMNQSQHV